MNTTTIKELSETPYVNFIRKKTIDSKNQGKDIVEELFIILPYGFENEEILNLLKSNKLFGEELYPESEYPEEATPESNLISNIHFLLQEEFL